MKTLFIPAKSKVKINKQKIIGISKKLPKNIAIAYSIQYKDIAEQIKPILRNHKITKFIQVLGCSKPILPKSTQAILLIGNARFHATSLAYETKLPVYLLDHFNFSKISKKDIEILEKKQKASFVRFLHADKVGILVSTKPGQQNLKKAIEFNKKMSRSGYPKTWNSRAKKSYLFISNNINPQEFENFGLNSWVNTACPRMDMADNSIINIRSLK